MRGIDNLRHVLVGFRRLLGDAGIGMAPDDDVPRCKQANDLPALPRLLGLGPRHGPACAVAGRAKGLLHTLFRARENVRRGAHGPADEHGLADIPVFHGQIDLPWPEGPRGAFAVHVKPLLPAVDDMRLHLAGVVADVVEHLDAAFGIDLGKDLPDQMGDDLAVRQGTVDPGAHGPEVFPPLRGIDGS